ncbi:hypothetical protein F5Y16DRAFT_419313 [Xylariaceae sp. FL0255]|nr:hypothetical protein F5Y16DRAFT_419313 [Xylariaceae sp. FL0255]
MSRAPEPTWTLDQARSIQYLTLRVLYERNVTQETIDRFLGALWPAGFSQAASQLRHVRSPSLIDKATRGRITYGEQRDGAIREALVQRVLDTKCISPVTLKGLLLACCAPASDRAARHQPGARWTLYQAYKILHLGDQIVLEERMTRDTMEWFVRAVWQEGCSPAMKYSQSAFMRSSLSERLFSPLGRVEESIREIFVQRVIGAGRITDSILDWLYTSLIRARRKETPLVGGEGPFNIASDGLDTDMEVSERGVIGNERPLPWSECCVGQTNTFFHLASDDEATSGIKTISPSQWAAGSVGFDIPKPGSTASDNNKYLVTAPASQFKDAVQSLLQLSHGDSPTAANHPMDAHRPQFDNGVFLIEPNQLCQFDSSCYTNSDEEPTGSQNAPATKKRRVEGACELRKRVRHLVK